MPRSRFAAPTLVTSLVLACGIPGVAHAQHMYTGQAGDNLWCTPQNWNPASVPSGSAIIGPEITQRVRFAGNCTPTFVSLTAQGPVTFNGAVRNSGSILASDVIIQSGNFEVGPATQGAATFSMNGVAQWISGIIARQEVRIEAGASLAIDPGSPKTLRIAPVNNFGSVSQRASVSIDGFSPMINEGTWTLASPGVRLMPTSIGNISTFLNIGTLESETGGGAAVFALPVRNEGEINANTGDLDLSEFTNVGGQLAASPGRRINLNAESTFSGSSQCSGDGTVTATSGLVRVASGTLLVALDQSGSRGGGFVLSGSTPGMTIGAGATLRNAGTFTWSRGTILGESGGLGSGVVRNEATFTASVSGGGTIQNIEFENTAGARFVVEAQTFLRDASIISGEFATLEFHSGSIVRSPQSGADTPTNLAFIRASLLKTTPSASRADCRVEATDSLIEVREGEFTFGSFTSTQPPHDLSGTVVLTERDAATAVRGPVRVIGEATLDGAGTLTIYQSLGELQLFGAVVRNEMRTGGVILEAGRITGIGGTFQNDGLLTLNGATLGDPDLSATSLVFENPGSMSVIGAGASRFAAVVRNSDSGLISVQSPIAMAAGATLDNDGEISIGDGASISALAGIPAPLVTNTFGAVIEKIEAGAANISAPLSNRGSLIVRQGTFAIIGPLSELVAIQAPAGTYSLEAGTYNVGPVASLSFAGRRISTLGGTASVTVQGSCSDYKPVRVSGQASTQLGTRVAPSEPFVAEDQSRVNLLPGGELGTAPGGSSDARFRGWSRLSGHGVVDRNVTLEGNGTISPGRSPGEITLRSLTMDGGELDIELGGPTPVTEHDRLTVVNTASLGGTLRVMLLDDFQPTAGSNFTILTAAAITGQFVQVIPPPDLDANLTMRVQNSGAGTLEVSFFCRADFTQDGGVDGDDVIAFFGAWDASDPAADFTLDGGVDGDDVIGFFGRWDVGC